MQSIESRVEDIENSILELERYDIEYGEKYRSALENSVLLLRESEKGPSYVQERAKRLHSLLFKIQDRLDYRSSFYNPIHRQISKIRDLDIVDYFSPTLKKRMDRIVPCMEQKGNLILFRLGKTKYAVFGVLKEKIDAMDAEKVSELLSCEEICCFPPESELFTGEIMNAESLLHVENRIHGNFGLYCDEVIDIRNVDRELTEKNIFPFGRPHPNVPGRIKLQGVSYCLVRPWIKTERLEHSKNS